jgi:hypothetical protein
MLNLHTPDQFKSRPARIVIAAVGLVLAYFLVTRAFDTGSWWQYFGTILLLVLSIRLIIKALKNKQ